MCFYDIPKVWRKNLQPLHHVWLFKHVVTFNFEEISTPLRKLRNWNFPPVDFDSKTEASTYPTKNIPQASAKAERIPKMIHCWWTWSGILSRVRMILIRKMKDYLKSVQGWKTLRKSLCFEWCGVVQGVGWIPLSHQTSKFLISNYLVLLYTP